MMSLGLARVALGAASFGFVGVGNVSFVPSGLFAFGFSVLSLCFAVCCFSLPLA
jgi:hypothetical protein